MFLTAGTIAVVNTDRLRNVVGRYFRNENLSGKVYIVTGSNTGIGIFILFHYFYYINILSLRKELLKNILK